MSITSYVSCESDESCEVTVESSLFNSLLGKINCEEIDLW